MNLRIAIATALIICLMAVGNAAATDNDSRHELALMLLERINAARVNPLAAASAIGRDLQQVLASLPVMADLLQNGLPPLAEQAQLVASATNHTNDMLSSDYYGETSPNGGTAADRILAAGYVAAKTGETLGVIAFRNFMDPVQAVSLIFQNMYSAELDPATTIPRKILDPEFKDIGVAIDTGSLTLGGEVYNVYVATCDFGTPTVSHQDQSGAEFYLMELINSARLDPLAAAQRLGMDPMPVSMLIFQRFPGGLPALTPLAYCNVLSDYARGATETTIQTLDAWALSADTVLIPVAPQARYLWATNVNGIIGYLENIGGLSTRGAVEAVFRSMMLAELGTSAGSGTSAIFDPDSRYVGVNFVHRVIFDELGPRRLYAVTATFAGPTLLSEAERNAMAMINQARRHPLLVAQWLGVSPDNADGNQPAALPPLVPDGRIYMAAEAHAADMVTHNYYDYYSFDGLKDLGDRLLESGFDSREFGEALGFRANSRAFDPSAEGAIQIDRLIAGALGDNFDDSQIRNPDMTHTAVRLQYTSPVTAGAGSGYFQKNHALLAVVDLAQTNGAKPLAIVGVVFEDSNQNGLQDPAEGLPLHPVTIDDGLIQRHLFTDDTGQFCVPLPSGTYQVRTAFLGLQQSVEISLNDEAVWIGLSF